MANFSVEWLSRSYYEETAKEPRSQFSPTSPNSKFTDQLPGLRPTGLCAGDSDEKGLNALLLPPDSCGYTSGSESEVGDDSEEEAAQQRRMRTKFTSEQISKLEETFSRHRYLGATHRRKFAEKLNLSETQVGSRQRRDRGQKKEARQKQLFCTILGKATPQGPIAWGPCCVVSNSVKPL